jgi:RHS repeat-associated protein
VVDAGQNLKIPAVSGSLELAAPQYGAKISSWSLLGNLRSLAVTLMLCLAVRAVSPQQKNLGIPASVAFAIPLLFNKRKGNDKFSEEQISDNFVYGAFGEGVQSSDREPFRYTGRRGGYADRVGVLNWNRWYFSDQGRWGSRDRFELRGGKNFYGYVDNNPLTLIDPTGHCELRPGQPLPPNSCIGRWSRFPQDDNDDPSGGWPAGNILTMAINGIERIIGVGGETASGSLTGNCQCAWKCSGKSGSHGSLRSQDSTFTPGHNDGSGCACIAPGPSYPDLDN